MKKSIKLIAIAGIFCSLIFAGDAEDVKQRIEDGFAHLNKMKKSLNDYSQDVSLSPLKSADEISSKYSPEYINRNSINNSRNRGFNMILMEEYDWETDYYGENGYWYLDASDHWTYDGNGNQIMWVERNGSGTAVDSTIYAYEETVGVDDFTVIPNQYNLSKPYPNPFNPLTVINFSIPKTKLVLINVYDIMGREIATIINKELVQGTHSFKWNANNQSSGIYFIKMQSGEFVKTQKVILLK